MCVNPNSGAKAYQSRDIRRNRYRSFLFCGAVLVFSSISEFDRAVSAEMHADAAERPSMITFDIPAQPLPSALELFSIAAGREVVYDGALASGRRSAELKGTYSVESAMLILLDGTDLLPRYLGDGIVLHQRKAASTDQPAGQNMAPQGDMMSYYGRVQASLRLAFCANDRTKRGGYRVAMNFWISPSGKVTRSERLGSTGDPNLDTSIDQTMHGLSIGFPPPAGFAQPVTLVIAPQPARMARDCQMVQAQPSSLRGGP
ncbi:MAG TPA: TonB family protein [Bradyrhizobium sp.]|nr:TonB family protein [Bradyrhizobium sp.]